MPSQQAYAHMLEVVKGFIDSATVSHTADVSPDVTIDIYAGRCIHLNAAGEWATGCLGNQLPYFAQNNSFASDAVNDGSPDWVGGIPNAKPKVTAISAKAAVVLATTEYDTAQTYAIGEPLRGVHADTAQATGGLLTNQAIVAGPTTTPASQTAVVGHVFRAPAKRQSDRPAVLMFTPSHNPGAAGL